MKGDDEVRKALSENPEGTRRMKTLIERGRAAASDVPKDVSATIICGFWPGVDHGSLRGTCDRCNRYVCVTKEAQDALRDRTAPTHFLCPPCAVRTLASGSFKNLD